MRQSTRAEIVKKYRQFSCPNMAAKSIASELDMSPNRVKAIVKAYMDEKSRKLVTYRIMKRKRQGLRLVRIKAGKASMDWYTDRDDRGIKEYVDGIASRLTGETL